MSRYNRSLGMLVATVLAMIHIGCNPDRSAEYEALQAQITLMQQQLIEAQTERAEWQAKYLEATQALAAARQELETLPNIAGTSPQPATTPAASTTALTAIRQALSQLQDEIAAARQEHLAALPETRRILRQEIAAFTQGRSQIPAESQAPGSEASSQALDQLRQTAQEAMTARDALQAQLIQVRTELELTQAERDEARLTLETTRTETADQTCQAQLSQLQNTVRTLTAARQQLSAQQGRIWEKTGEIRKMKEQSAQQLQESIQAKIVTLHQDEDELRIRIGGRILFNPGAVTLRTQGRQTLDQIATILQRYPDYRIRVEGHTDNDPVTNPDRKCWPTNWELSALRAASAVRYLETQHIASERLGIVGLAYHQPLVSNDTSEGKARNRRIEIRVSPSPR